MAADSRPQTPSSLLSGLTWQQGPTVFFSQGVPFSYGVGRTLAERIYNAYVMMNPTPTPPQGGENNFDSGDSLRAAPSDQPHTPENTDARAGTDNAPAQNQFMTKHPHATVNQPHIPENTNRLFVSRAPTALEIGAGLGYLSKNILDLAGEIPFQWHITDGSSALVSHWKTAQLFQSYPQASLQTLDLETPFSWETPLDLILMSYVLDSTPTCHLEWKNNRLYEWVMTTEFADTEVLVPADTSVYIQTQPAADVWAHWAQYAETDRPWIAPRLSRACHETWHRIPATESRYLTDDDIAFVTDFLRDTHAQDSLFNYAPIMRKRIPELIGALSPTGLIALHDFGYQTAKGANQPEDLCTRFNAIQAYPLHFPLVTWIATRCGAHATISNAPEGESALCMISKKPLPSTWQDTDSCYTQAHTLQNTLNGLSAENADIWATTAEPITDYAILSHLTEQSTRKSYWVQKAIALYPDLAIPSYGQYAQQHIGAGDYSKAKQILEEAYKRFPLDPTITLSLANIYVRDKNWKAAQALLLSIIQKLNDPLAWHVQKMIQLLDRNVPKTAL